MTDSNTTYMKSEGRKREREETIEFRATFKVTIRVTLMVKSWPRRRVKGGEKRMDVKRKQKTNVPLEPA